MKKYRVKIKTKNQGRQTFIITGSSSLDVFRRVLKTVDPGDEIKSVAVGKSSCI